tara:strand:- start:238 stop:750 length:513 start_codon:yes stop_codon:yes gene_type:complete
MKFTDLQKADKPSWTNVIKDWKRHSVNTVISAIILLKSDGEVSLEVEEHINVFERENHLDLGDSNLETLKTSIIASEENAIEVTNDGGSGDTSYWMATVISVLLYNFLVNGISDFFTFIFLSVGAFLLPLIISLPIYLFIKRIGFVKILCYTTVIITITGYLGHLSINQG